MIERIFDKQQILAVLRHPTIWPHIGGRDDFDPPLDEDHHYLLVNGGEGLFILHPGYYGHKIHANMIARGDTAIQAAKDALAYAFEFTSAVYAEIPTEFDNVFRFANQFMDHISTKNGTHLLILERKKWAS